MRPDARNLNEEVESFETHTLDLGQKKYTVEYDPLDERSAIFTFNREDETLGNLLRSALLANDHVLFCASKIEHPLEYKITLRVTTDETTNPEEAIVACSKRLIEDLNVLSLRLTREWEIAKMATGIGSQTPEHGKGAFAAKE